MAGMVKDSSSVGRLVLLVLSAIWSVVRWNDVVARIGARFVAFGMSGDRMRRGTNEVGIALAPIGDVAAILAMHAPLSYHNLRPPTRSSGEGAEWSTLVLKIQCIQYD